jgi:hypothetical protein
LLEDVLDPSRNVDPAFRQTTVQLTDGRIVSGLVLREDARTLTIADARGKEIAVDRGRIEHRAASSLSAMPANAGETLSDRDFAAVMHYLFSLTGSGSQNPGGNSCNPAQAGRGTASRRCNNRTARLIWGSGENRQVVPGVRVVFLNFRWRRVR